MTICAEAGDADCRKPNQNRTYVNRHFIAHNPLWRCGARTDAAGEYTREYAEFRKN